MPEDKQRHKQTTHSLVTYEGVQYYLGCTFLEQWQKALRRSLLGQGFKLPDWPPADGCCNAYPLPIQEAFPLVVT